MRRTIDLNENLNESDLAEKIRGGDTRARWQMILANLRLVINIAKRCAHLGVLLLDLIEDETRGSPEQQIEQFLQHEHADALLDGMKERERRILTLRYGLNDGVSRTLGETARYFRVSRELVRQIEAGALRKLRRMVSVEGRQA